MSEDINQQTFALPQDLSAAVEAALDDWDTEDKVRRLWERDASLWTNGDEGKWLGWLSIVDEQQRSIRRFPNFSLEVKDAGFSHTLLLGMGGSSLCPEVMSRSFGKIEGFPELHVLDSTDPAQIRTLENKIDPANTLFIVSSKSGSTLEPNIFKQYLFERVRQVVGDDEVGNRFVAITDPGSRLRQEAENDRFRKIFLGVPSIGGRYSALSDFGLAPAAAMGVDVAKFLDRTHEMVKACGADVSARNNPGVILGALLGVAHDQERDKITIFASPGIHDLGAWLEQLLAESTGKNGKGLVPVDREAPTSPEGDGIKLFADEKSAQALNEAVGESSLPGYLKAHFDRLVAGDYFALLAYLEMNDKHETSLQSMRRAVRDRRRVATCLGFGPRFLHSTGQAYKGGPNTGVFLQITCDDAVDVPVPGQKYTFGVVKAAQAQGDFQVLVERGRRALRIHLGKDVKGGLATLRSAVSQATA